MAKDTIHTVTIALLTNAGLVLLLQRNPAEYPGHGDAWELIGGHIQEDETPEQAARREIVEETGIMGVSLQFVGISLFNTKGGQEASNTVYAVFLAAEIEVTRSNEHQADKWTPLHEALAIKLACKHSELLAQIVGQFQML